MTTTVLSQSAAREKDIEGEYGLWLGNECGRYWIFWGVLSSVKSFHPLYYLWSRSYILVKTTFSLVDTFTIYMSLCHELYMTCCLMNHARASIITIITPLRCLTFVNLFWPEPGIEPATNCLRGRHVATELTRLVYIFIKNFCIEYNHT